MKIFLSLVIFLASMLTVAAQSKPLLLNTEDKFSPDGKIEIDEGSKVEIGKINNVSYRFYYTDASGSFSGMPGASWKR